MNNISLKAIYDVINSNKSSEGFNLFEDSCRVLLTSTNTKNVRLLENFLCCGHSYNEFSKQYQILRDRINNPEYRDFALEIPTILQQYMQQTILPQPSVLLMIMCIFSCYIDKDYNFKIGSIKFNNELTRVIYNIFNKVNSSRMSYVEVSKFLDADGIMNTIPKSVLDAVGKKEIGCHTLICILSTCTIGLLEPAMYLNDVYYDNVVRFAKSLVKQIEKLYKDGVRNISTTAFKLLPPHVKMVILKQEFDLGVCFVKDEFYMKDANDILGKLVRTGYLSNDNCKGVITSDDIKYKFDGMSNNEAKAIYSLMSPLKYMIQEVVSKDGIKIFYYLYSPNYMNFVFIEDYTTDNISASVYFLDKIYSENTKETISATMCAMYKMLRNKYQKLIQSEESINNKPIISHKERCHNCGDYETKMVYIAPYKRRVSSPDYQARPETYEMASRYNIVLERGETLVSDFVRQQRVLADNTKTKSNVIKSITFGKKGES